MQDVVRMSCPPRRSLPAARRPHGYVAPALAATVFAALALHLLAELVRRFDPLDPAAALSVALGAAAVLATLAPFAVLFAARARAAWRWEAADADRHGPALAPGPR